MDLFRSACVGTALAVSVLGARGFAATLFSDNFDTNDPTLASPYGFGLANPATYTIGTTVHTLPTAAGSKWQLLDGLVDLTDHTDSRFSTNTGGADPDPTDAHKHFVELNGTYGLSDITSDFAFPGSILNKTPISLPGAGTYDLSFDLAGSHVKGGPVSDGTTFSRTINIQVFDGPPGNVDAVFDLSPGQPVLNMSLDWNADWETVNLTFTTTKAYSDVFLQFQDGSTKDQEAFGNGLLLDNVVLQTAPAPEPASLGLLAIGAVSVLGRRRRAR